MVKKLFIIICSRESYSEFFKPEIKNKKNFQKHLIFFGLIGIIIFALRGVAKFGIALGSGPRGHGFKSRHSDHIEYS